MPECDAFGREIGEDPLAALREATAAAPKPEPVEPAPEAPAPKAAPVESAPKAAPVEAAPKAPLARPEFVRPRRRRRGMTSLLVLATLICALGLGSAFVADRVEDLVDELPTIEGPEPAPTGVDQRSLIRQANFAAVLEVLREAGEGRPVTLRVAPDRVDATLAGPDGIRQVQVTADHRLRTLATTDAGAMPPTMPYRRIDAAAPERLVRAADVPARRIDHVLLVPGRPVTWRATFRDGTVVTGDARGRPR